MKLLKFFSAILAPRLYRSVPPFSELVPTNYPRKNRFSSAGAGRATSVPQQLRFSPTLHLDRFSFVGENRRARIRKTGGTRRGTIIGDKNSKHFKVDTIYVDRFTDIGQNKRYSPWGNIIFAGFDDGLTFHVVRLPSLWLHVNCFPSKCQSMDLSESPHCQRHSGFFVFRSHNTIRPVSKPMSN